jgi:hypothetical protein
MCRRMGQVCEYGVQKRHRQEEGRERRRRVHLLWVGFNRIGPEPTSRDVCRVVGVEGKVDMPLTLLDDRPPHRQAGDGPLVRPQFLSGWLPR